MGGVPILRPKAARLAQPPPLDVFGTFPYLTMIDGSMINEIIDIIEPSQFPGFEALHSLYIGAEYLFPSFLRFMELSINCSYKPLYILLGV